MQEIKKSLDRYVKNRIPTGGFLQAVLSNDLMRAVRKADHINIAKLPEICRYVYNEIPGNCWGSPEIVKKWLQGDTTHGFVNSFEAVDELLEVMEHAHAKHFKE